MNENEDKGIRESDEKEGRRKEGRKGRKKKKILSENHTLRP